MRPNTSAFWPTIMAVIVVAGFAQAKSGQSFHPKDGFVPNAETAVQVGAAVLIPVYGKKQIESERPFKAILSNNVWIVEGTLNCAGLPDEGREHPCDGGTAVVRISKATGQILSIMHYK